MEEIIQTQLPKFEVTDPQQAWEMVSGQLRLEMSRTLFETYVQPLQALSYKDGVFTLGTYNPYTRQWVENRLKSLITRQLEGLFNRKITLKIDVADEFSHQLSSPVVSQNGIFRSPAGETVREEIPEEESVVQPKGKSSSRKLALQRAYGSQRAAIIQPERTLLVTQYFFSNWLPLLGHSSFAVILAARSMCYWNPLNGELRNEIETEMGELAQRAAVSVRTVKTVLNEDLVRQNFLRYKTRRIMTVHGIRTAGILLLVRMDDPLTPADQIKFNLPEEERWFSSDFIEIEKED